MEKSGNHFVQGILRYLIFFYGTPSFFLCVWSWEGIRCLPGGGKINGAWKKFHGKSQHS